MATAADKAGGVDKVRALLELLAQDEYVRFKYGKAVDAARKTLDAQALLDTAELERRLLSLVELVRGSTEGPASRGPKSGKRISKEPGHALP